MLYNPSLAITIEQGIRVSTRFRNDSGAFSSNKAYSIMPIGMSNSISSYIIVLCFSCGGQLSCLQHTQSVWFNQDYPGFISWERRGVCIVYAENRQASTYLYSVESLLEILCFCVKENLTMFFE